jgi:hypothetical protein
VLERAFQVAGSWSVAKLSDLIRSLESQGYDGRQIYGPVLRRQLTAIIRTARNASAISQPERASANDGDIPASAQSEVHVGRSRTN